MRTDAIQAILLLVLSFVCWSDPQIFDAEKTVSQGHLRVAKHALKSNNYVLAIEQLDQALEQLTDIDSIKTQVSIHMNYGLLMLNTSRKNTSAIHYKKAYHWGQLTNEANLPI